jgi:hypothetical protein
MTSVSQDVSRPGSFASRFSAGNAASIRPSLNKQHMLLASLPKVGKSKLCADNPEALVLNFDLTAFLPGTRAAVWPIRGEDGYTYESGPQGLKKLPPVKFEDYLKIQEELIEMAARNDPARPQMIVIDTVTKMCNLVQDYLLKQSGKTDFKQLGMDGWAERNRVVEGFGRRLYAAGYGVVELLHVAPKYIPVLNQQTGETVHTKEITPTISDGLWNSLFVAPSVIASVEIKAATTIVAGKPVTKSVRVLKVFKNVLDAQTGGTRVPLPPEIELSSEHPWDSLRTAFDESVKSL